MPQISPSGTAYELHGSAEQPTIALIHGLGLTRETWNGLLPDLTKNFRVLNYDLFGHGQSIAPPETPNVSLFATQLRDLMDALEIDQAALVGFSLGGMINRRFAMDYSSRASALVVLNSPHDRGKEQQERVEQQAKDAANTGPAATLDAAITRWFSTQFRQDYPDQIERVREWVLANDPAIYAQCRWVLANGVVELTTPQPPITHPTLVITCENDQGSTPTMSHAIAREIANSETAIIPSLKHMGLMERPDLFSQPIIEFLNRHQ